MTLYPGLTSRFTVSFWKHHPVADQKAETLAAGTIAFYEKFKCDFIKLSPAGCWLASCYGIGDAWLNDPLGSRTITRTVINETSDWLSLPDFSTTAPDMLREITGACHLVSSHFTLDRPVFCTVFSPISQAVQLAGLDTFVRHVKESPSNVIRGLERITNNTKVAIQALKESGAMGIYFVTQQMRYDGVRQSIYDEYGAPFDTHCLKACEDFPITIFHIHGHKIYFSFNELPENCVVHYESASSNPKAEEFYQNHANQLSLGIPSDDMLKAASDMEIKKILRRYTFKNQEQNIVTAGCVLPLSFPDETLSKWVDTVKSIN